MMRYPSLKGLCLLRMKSSTNGIIPIVAKTYRIKSPFIKSPFQNEKKYIDNFVYKYDVIYAFAHSNYIISN